MIRYDRYRGVISLVNIQDGILRKGKYLHFSQLEKTHISSLGDKIASCHTRKKYEVVDLGIMYPEEVTTSELRPGQVGYIACNMKDSSEGERHTIQRDLGHSMSDQRTLETLSIAWVRLWRQCPVSSPPRPW